MVSCSEHIREGFAGTVGNTPLMRIPSLSEATGCTILAKCEHLNPGGSVKDRAALFMLDDAMKTGALAPGGTVVEGTAGNTGIGLALLARARGLRCIIVMPSNQSDEKVALLRTLGARVELVEPCSFSSDAHYYHTARRRADEEGGFWANQFENPMNAEAHYRGTGPELWRQTNGQLDAFVCATGTGGTIGGTTAYLKEQRKDVHCAVADAEGSSMYAWVTERTLDAPGSSLLEGIGIKRVTANFARARLDSALRVRDAEAIEMVYYLARREGLFVGGSAGLNVTAAVKLARRLGPGKVIVTVLCDGASRYLSRLFSEDWLAEHGFRVKAKGLEFIEDAG
jgi:cysteine synthase A